MVTYGVMSALYFGPFTVVYSIFGLPFYGMYPFSLIIFGGFSALLTASKDRTLGLLVAIAAGTMFDMIGTATAFKHPDLYSFVFWVAPVFMAFTLSKRSIGKFLWSKPFLAFFVFDLFFVKLLPNVNVISDLMELATEAVWCLCFYFAFYGKAPTGSPRNPLVA